MYSGPSGRRMLTAILLAILLALAGAASAKDKGGHAKKPPKIKGPLVAVGLTEYAVEMPASFRHGWVTLSITNKGEVPHALNGQDGKKTYSLCPQVAPGQTVLVPIKLRKGTFMVYCSTAEHARAGMQAVAYVQ